MASSTDPQSLAALSSKQLKQRLAEKGIDSSSCFEKAELITLLSSAGAESPTIPPVADATHSGSSSTVPSEGPTEPLASVASLSVSQLKELLDAHGIDRSKCMYRSELEALAKGLPLPTSASTAESGRPPAKVPKVKAPSVEQISGLDGPALFAALRALPGDTATRRDFTRRVHAVKMAMWRLKPAFRGMARHLTEDVHPMFRSAFDSVLQASVKRGSVVVSSFESVNRSLHGHHGTEDAHWFPVLKRAHPELAPEVAVLEADHRALVALEGRITGAAKELAALKEFVALLNDHLNREEMLTVPSLMDGTGGL